MNKQMRQLKADLSVIGDGVKCADVPDGVKALFGEVLAWNEASLDHIADLNARLEEADAALTELIEGEGEMISAETAASFMATIENTQLLCHAVSALLEGQHGAAVDEMTKKRFAQLIENTVRSCAVSSQIVHELTADGDEEETEDGDDGDGLGDGNGDADAEGGDEAEANE
jgi:hypothetical protein